MTLTERIFDLLSQKGKTQTDIARLLNVRPTTVSEWRKGKYTPSVANCVALADFFGVSLDYLITGREPRGAPVQQIIGNNNSNNTAIAGGAVSAGDIGEYERELLKVAGAFDMRRKNDLLSYAYKLEKQIKDEGGL
ncbi:MAG: helix-turn-helix domain-containing protein [Lachnospiraceae bacterium]|nr:helix-turn-helix domain-containing protein [Lachnospiraceae bacterium]